DGGEISVTITPGVYSADTLAQEIENQMNASGVSGACDYQAIYIDAYNVFAIFTYPSCVFELKTTTALDAIWDVIGFDTAADTGFDSYHQGDYIRIHTEEWVKIDAGVGNTISACAAFTFYDNLQDTATLKIQFSNDNFATIPIDLSMTKGEFLYILLFDGLLPPSAPELTTFSYRYVRFYIQDIDNPDGFIELGRCWLGCPFWPKLGFDPKHKNVPVDASIIKESDGGQASTVQRTHFKRWNYNFGYGTQRTGQPDKAGFDALFASRGVSKEWVALEMPSTSSARVFSNPQD
ncbi:unnamed protein product, partial [marine sediment metagenome]